MKHRSGSRKYARVIKRFCDILFSLLGIIILLPAWLVIGILVKASVPGSVLFRQTRVGYREKRFQILKFRTMRDGSSGERDVPASMKRLRRLRLDELPQLWNILIGEMSFVGPRPYIVKESRGLDPERYRMRPGMTGLGQVNGNRELGWEERTAYDVDYVRDFSLGLDMKILLRTVKVIVQGETACVRHREK